MGTEPELPPPVFERPVWRDSFLWLFVATLALWAVIVWLVFF